MKDLSGIEYDIDCVVNKKQKIIIWGAGMYGRYIYRYLSRHAITVYAVADRREDIKAPVPSVKLQQLDHLEQYIFIIAVRCKREKLEIKEQLLEYGVKPTQIVIPIPDMDSEFYDFSLMDHPDFVHPVVAARWNQVRRKGSQISNYFEKNDIYRIGVYEIKEFAGWLENDLVWSKVSVCQKITEECSIDEDLDAVIVTDVLRFDYVEEQVKMRTKCPVINIIEVLK